MVTIAKPPTRKQLEVIAGRDQELIRALERLFQQALNLTPTEFSQLQEQVAQDTSAIAANTNAISDLSDGTTGITPDLLTGWGVGGVPVTASAAELNILDGATLTTAELNNVDGTTGNIQTQLDAKLDIADLGAETGSLAYNSIGTYVMARDNTGSQTFPGNVVSGSNLNPCNTSGTSVGAALSGNWKCMGRTATGTGTANDITLWLRVS